MVSAVRCGARSLTVVRLIDPSARRSSVTGNLRAVRAAAMRLYVPCSENRNVSRQYSKRGSFWMGTGGGSPPECPRRELFLPRYYIARYPVTVAQFGAF